MCPVLLAAVLLGSEVAPARGADAPPLAKWDFEADEDRDFDRWPDGWTRRRGLGFPHVVAAELDAGALRFAAGGGAAAAYSPAVAVPAGAAVRLTGRARCDGLHADAAVLSLSLLDAAGRRLARFLSEPVTGDAAADLAVGPVPPRTGAVKAVVGVHLVPGAEPGVTGAVRFEGVTLSATPHLSVELDPPGVTVPVGEPLTATVTAGGFGGGPVPEAAVLRIAGPAGDAAAVSVPLAAAGATAAGRTVAAPDRPGLWALTVELPFAGSVFPRTVTVAAVDPGTVSDRPAARSRVGWTLPFAPPAEDAEAVAKAAAAGGAGWVRWGLATARDDAAFAAALRAAGVRAVGVLTGDPFGGRPGESLADVLASRRDAAAVIAAVVGPLAADVRHWQLGRDDEPAPLVPDRRPTVAGLVRAAAPGVVTAGPAWSGADVRVMSGDEPAAGRAWRVLDVEAGPAPLARRLLTALAADDGPVFLPDATDPAAGLLTVAGPSPRFVAARTTAAAVGAGRPLGLVALPVGPGGTPPTALAFDAPGGAALAVFGDAIGRADVRLGGRPFSRGLGGNAVPLAPGVGGTHRLTWGPTPRLTEGLDRDLLRFRLGVRPAAGGALRSTADPQPFVVRVTNPFESAVTATVTPRFLIGWRAEPATAAVSLDPGRAGEAAFTVSLPPQVSLGGHSVSLDVRLTGGPGGTLTVPRTARVRLDDMRLTVTDRTLPPTGGKAGGWEVTQTLSHTLPAGEAPAFRCDLLVPGAARVSRRTGPLPAGSHTLSFRLPATAEAGGTVWLRVSEVGGNRVLNRKWPLGSPPAETE